MIFAFNLNMNNKIIAKKQTQGLCPGCHDKLIPKCGNERIHHWAHFANKKCIYGEYSDNATSYLWKTNIDSTKCEILYENYLIDIKGNYDCNIMFYKNQKDKYITNINYSLSHNVIWIYPAENIENYEVILKEKRESFIWTNPKYSIISNLYDGVKTFIDFSNAEIDGFLFEVKEYKTIKYMQLFGTWIDFYSFKMKYLLTN